MNRADRPSLAAPAALLALLAWTGAFAACAASSAVAAPDQAAVAQDDDGNEPAKSVEDGPPREKVVVRDRTFRLERAFDPVSRARGLSGRKTLEPDGGMLFAYPSPRELSFWMKGCLIDLDIAYVDQHGRVTATYTMKHERPQRENESDWAYESRLRSYTSRRPAQFALEFRAGTIRDIGLRVGDVIALDVKRLEALSR